MFPMQMGCAKWEHGWEESYWWVRLQTVAAEGVSHALMLKTVERKLRLPWSVFDSLAREMEADPDLQQSNPRAVPLRLKLCAALRHLATGHSLDGLEESFKMSAQTMRDFFWGTFIPWMMARKYEENVYAPRNMDELQEVCDEYDYAGFPGCCGSVDGVHVLWYGFKSGARADFVGKEKQPTLVFGVTVDHRYRIMHVTSAHAGTTNDKFVIRGDDFHTRIMHTQLYKDYKFDLLTSRDGIRARYKGCYVLCDGGYGDWRNLVSAFSCVEPFSHRANWSHRVGSVRKDSECTFGVLKARFRVLTSRIYRCNATDVENMFKVCCCLHNMIMRARDARLATTHTTISTSRNLRQKVLSAAVASLQVKNEVDTPAYARNVNHDIACSKLHFVRARQREHNIIRITRTARCIGLSLLRPPRPHHCVHDRVYIVPSAENSVVMFKVLDELST